MKDLCSRARAAMNLLLVLSLVLGWLALSKTETYESIGVEAKIAIFPFLNENTVKLEKQSPSVVALLKSLDVNPRDRLGDYTIQSLPLSQLFAITASDYISLEDENIEKFENSKGNDEGKQHAKKILHARIERAVESMSRVRELAAARGLTLATATVGDLEKTYPRDIDLPILKQHLELADAFWIAGIATLGILAIIVTLMDSLMILVAEKDEDPDDTQDLEPMDFVLLYRSKWAFRVGVPWLLLPTLMILLNLIFPIHVPQLGYVESRLWRWVFGAILAGATITLSGMVIRRARRIRQSFPRAKLGKM